MILYVKFDLFIYEFKDLGREDKPALVQKNRLGTASRLTKRFVRQLAPEQTTAPGTVCSSYRCPEELNRRGVVCKFSKPERADWDAPSNSNAQHYHCYLVPWASLGTTILQLASPSFIIIKSEIWLWQTSPQFPTVFFFPQTYPDWATLP